MHISLLIDVFIVRIYGQQNVFSYVLLLVRLLSDYCFLLNMEPWCDLRHVSPHHHSHYLLYLFGAVYVFVVVLMF